MLISFPVLYSRKTTPTRNRCINTSPNSRCTTRTTWAAWSTRPTSRLSTWSWNRARSGCAVSQFSPPLVAEAVAFTIQLKTLPLNISSIRSSRRRRRLQWQRRTLPGIWLPPLLRPHRTTAAELVEMENPHLPRSTVEISCFEIRKKNYRIYWCVS